MSGKLLSGLMLLAALGAFGCARDESTGDALALESENARLRRRVDDLRAEVEELRTAATLSAERVKELKARDERLTERVERLRFLVRAQDDQIETLKRVPAERDKYRAEAKRLRDEVLRLRDEIKRLNALLVDEVLTKTAPATMTPSAPVNTTPPETGPGE